MNNQRIFNLVVAFFCGVLVAVIAMSAEADDSKPHLGETAISGAWCEAHGGIAEAILSDGSRADCILPDAAVEHDWGAKLKPMECLGQALLYSRLTGRAPLCVLIRKNGQSAKDFLRYSQRALIASYGVVSVECITENIEPFDCAMPPE